MNPVTLDILTTLGTAIYSASAKAIDGKSKRHEALLTVEARHPEFAHKREHEPWLRLASEAIVIAMKAGHSMERAIILADSVLTTSEAWLMFAFAAVIP